MSDFEIQEEIKNLKAELKEAKALNADLALKLGETKEINENLVKALGAKEEALKNYELKATTDAETIRVLREMNATYEGQIEAFKFCVRNGVKI